jgi:uncharacterized protein (DUF488 family)
MKKRARLSGLATIGYERVSLTGMLDTLTAAGVTLLLDVRELPVSRRKGFSKSSLSQALAKLGIGYEHARALGSPRDIRHRLRRDGDLERYFVDFRKYLKTQNTLLDDLARRLSGCVALLCFEREPAECHRSVVAAALASRTRLRVEHLRVPLHESQQASH